MSFCFVEIHRRRRPLLYPQSVLAHPGMYNDFYPEPFQPNVLIYSNPESPIFNLKESTPETFILVAEAGVAAPPPSFLHRLTMMKLQGLPYVKPR